MDNKKVHVLYILTKLELGGAQKVCLTLFKGIQKQNLSGSLISGEEGVLVSEVSKFESVFLLKNLKREIGLFSIFSELKTFFKIIKIIKKLKKNTPILIVHTHSTKAGILGRWAAFFSGIKNRVHTVHGFAFHEHQGKLRWSIIFFAEYITALITTKFICVSEYDAKIGSKLLPGFSKKYSIIRAAVDYEKFYIPANKTILKENFITIGTVACFKPQKNLFDLLKAFKQAYEKIGLLTNLKLQIIGDGILRPAIEEWIKQNNLSSNIELLGWQNDVSYWMQQWDIFALSSLWEGLPCAIIEARLSKLPVVSYKIAGIPEVIFDGKNGFLINAGDWQSFAQKLELISIDSNVRNKMSNYQDNVFEFKNLTMIERHINLYKKLV